MRRFAAAGIAAAAFITSCAGAPAAARNRDVPEGVDLTPNGRGAYVAMAGAFDLYEIRAGEIARRQSRSPAIRQFAEAVIGDHRTTTRNLLSAARAVGMEGLPPAMMPMHWDMLRRLERASRSRFDRLYARQQVRAHELALDLHRNYAEHGDEPVLREVAAAAAPVVARHLARAQELD